MSSILKDFNKLVEELGLSGIEQNVWSLYSKATNFDISILEDKRYSPDVRRKIFGYIHHNFLEPDIYSKYINPQYSIKLVSQICQILDCNELDIKFREQMINLLVMEN